MSLMAHHGDWQTKSERLLDEYMEDRPMFGGGDDADEMRETIRQASDREDFDEMTLADIKKLQDKDA